jgi:hypothetical protein
MTRVKCRKCTKVYEQSLSGVLIAPHVGPLHYIKCPACGKRSWTNVYSPVKDPVTWPPEATQEQAIQPELSAEELENKRIEESKYEKI